MRTYGTMLVSMTALAVALTVLSPGATASGDTNSAEPTFTYEVVNRALDENTSLNSTETLSQSAFLGATVTPDDLGLSMLEIDDVVAVVNHSLVRDGRGAIAAATAEYVDLSWAPMPGVKEYVVTRNDEVLGITTERAFRDASVSPGSTREYRVAAHSFTGPSDQQAPIHGLVVTTPEASSDPRRAALRQIEESAQSAAAYTSATVNWYTFIPQSRIDAPFTGCQYGLGYQFGGDGRGFASDSSSASSGGYRTWLQGAVAWTRAGNPVDKASFVGWTSVYDAKTGASVARRQAKGTLDARLLGTDPGRTYVDVRMSLQVGNPFCGGNSIEGAFSITLTRAGSYTIFSGEHRQMPNHEIFLQGFKNGASRTIYQRKYANAICLVNIACPKAQMGASGPF